MNDQVFPGESVTERTLRLMREEWEAPLRAERDRYRAALLLIREGHYEGPYNEAVGRITREALNDEAGKR